MTAISIHELHENTALWVSKATEQETIVLTDKGQPVAKDRAAARRESGESIPHVQASAGV